VIKFTRFPWPPAPFADLHWALHTDRTLSGRELDRENDDEGRRHGRVHGGNRNDLDEWAGERHTDFLSPPEINRDWKTISLPTESAEFAVLF